MLGKWFPLLGLGFAVAGADKLLGMRAYDRLFAKWGWSETTRQLIGVGEFTGGVLVASATLRHLGGWLLTATSAAMLTAENGAEGAGPGAAARTAAGRGGDGAAVTTTLADERVRAVPSPLPRAGEVAAA